jgi:hypothetical protein
MADTTQRGIKDSVIIQQQQEEIEALKAQVKQNRNFLEEQVEQNKKAEAVKVKEHEKKLYKWLTKRMEEMVTEIMNSRTEATPQSIPIPETPQPQTRFSVPPAGPTPGQPKFATSTPYTAAYGRGNPETPHPQNIYGSSSTYNFEQSRTRPGYTPQETPNETAAASLAETRFGKVSDIKLLEENSKHFWTQRRPTLRLTELTWKDSLSDWRG